MGERYGLWKRKGTSPVNLLCALGHLSEPHVFCFLFCKLNVPVKDQPSSSKNQVKRFTWGERLWGDLAQA